MEPGGSTVKEERMEYWNVGVVEDIETGVTEDGSIGVVEYWNNGGLEGWHWLRGFDA